MIRSIRMRLVLMMLAGLAVSMALGGWLLYIQMEQSLIAQLDESLARRVRTATHLISVSENGIDLDETGEDQGVLSYEKFQLTTSHGKSLLHSVGVLLHDTLPIELLQLGEIHAGDCEFGDDRDGRFASLLFVPDPDEEGLGNSRPSEPLILTIFEGRDAVDDALSALLAGLGGTAMVVVLVTLPLIWWGIRFGLRPLDRLVRVLPTIEAGSGRVPGMPPRVPQELEPVYRELTQLVVRLQEAISREQRFIDAAAHELRTPLAELRTLLDVARAWPDTRRVELALTQAGEIGCEMEHLVETLLMLNRKVYSVGEEQVVIAPLVRALVEKANRADQSCEMILDGQAQWTMTTQAAQIVLRNLISNALEYTPADGTVKIELSADGTLRVTNGPVSLSEADAGKVFEPFWRSEVSRTDRQHLGLGLTTAQHVARQCGLNCNAKMTGSFLCVTVTEETQ